MADLSDDYLNAIIEHATGYDGDGTQAMNSGDLQSIARAAIAADRALNTQAAAEPVANPNDPQWMAFVSWAQKRWGSETWRHTSNTCGEWDAWQAGRLAERAAIAAPPQQAPVAPAGWRMVPVEPTYHMLRESLIPAAEAARYYARMLAAAPAPAQAVPLTDDQILQIASTIPRDDLIHDFARAIERAHGITGAKP